MMVLSVSSVAFGLDSSEVRATYGRGVHAYFSGQSSSADQYLTQAVDSGSTDPRVYYFRAMVRLQMGRQAEAQNDMRVGAALEARDPGSQHAIGRALQRVQGPGRRALERFRREARLKRVQQRRSRSQNRYDRLQQRGPVVLYRDEPVLLEQLVEPSLEREMPAVRASADSPVQPAVPALGEVASPPPVTPMPVNVPDDLPDSAPEPAAEDDLFGQPASPAPVDPADDLFDEPLPAEADPFGQPTVEAETGDPVPEPAEPMPEDDPFGGSPDPAPADDPFGSPEEEDAGDDPFAEPTESETPDNSESEGDADESTESADDPFGETQSSSEDDNPFDESTDSGESEESMEDEQPAEGEDVDDLFGAAPIAVPAGEFGAAEGRTAVMQPQQLFFRLGQFLGSLSNPVALSPSAEAPAAVASAEFDLGPSDQFDAVPASAEQPMAEPTAETQASDDPFGTDAVEVEAAPADASDDPFGAETTEPTEDADAEDDPFGGF